MEREDGLQQKEFNALLVLQERCWTAVSKLESQVVRNPDLPPLYQRHVTEAFASLNVLSGVTGGMRGPWRVSGKTEDGRMYTVSDRDGFVVAQVFSVETARVLVALSLL